MTAFSEYPSVADSAVPNSALAVSFCSPSGICPIIALLLFAESACGPGCVSPQDLSLVMCACIRIAPGVLLNAVGLGQPPELANQAIARRAHLVTEPCCTHGVGRTIGLHGYGMTQ